jgi:multiple sugar transport system substrate-binding protein
MTGAGFALTACVAAAPTGQPSEPAAQATEIEVWHVNENELDPIIKTFEAANPGVKVKFQYYPWGDFFDKLDTAYAAGTPPDVHRQDDDAIPFFAQRNVLLPLDEYLLNTLNKDDLYWSAVESTMINGKLWVAISAMRVDNFIYNKSMFDAAGVAFPPTTYPSEAWTFDKFRETAAALSKPDELIFGAAGVDNADFMTTIGRSSGGRILDEECLEFLMHESAMVNAIQAAADMMQVEKSAADPETMSAMGGGMEMFNLGQAAMVYGQTRDVPAADVEFEWDVAPMPIIPGNDPVVFSAIECWGVPQVSEQREQAVAFAAHLMSQESQLLFAQTKNIIPINKKAATEIWAAPDKVPPSRKLLVEQLAYGQTLPFAVAFGEVQDIAWPAIQEVALGQKTAQTAMDEVKPLCDQVLQTAGGCLGAPA